MATLPRTFARSSESVAAIVYFCVRALWLGSGGIGGGPWASTRGDAAATSAASAAATLGTRWGARIVGRILGMRWAPARTRRGRARKSFRAAQGAWGVVRQSFRGSLSRAAHRWPGSLGTRGRQQWPWKDWIVRRAN